MFRRLLVPLFQSRSFLQWFGNEYKPIQETWGYVFGRERVISIDGFDLNTFNYAHILISDVI